MSLEFPCSFLLVCAMNPCPCGYLGDVAPRGAPSGTAPGSSGKHSAQMEGRRKCRCSPHDVQRYRSRISGPLLDRIDLQVDVPVAPFDRLVEERRGEPSATVRQRVEAAREIQRRRFASGVSLKAGTRANGLMTPAWGNIRPAFLPISLLPPFAQFPPLI